MGSDSPERRFGHFLHNQKREDYMLSSKVGKLFKASKNNKHADIYPLSDLPNDIIFDYTADGVRRSIEDSLQRLGVDSLDVAFVHDISPDFAFFPNGWEEQYEIARKGAFPALSKMRDEGIIRAWGIGVNTPLPILKVMEDADPDVCLCARQYSLIDHASAVNELFPVVRKRTFRSSSAPLSTPASSQEVHVTITEKRTSRFPQPSSRSGRSSGRSPLGMAWTSELPHFSFRRRPTSRSLWSWGTERSTDPGGLEFAPSQDPLGFLG